MSKGTERQVGGNHYAKSGVQPIQFIAQHHLNFFQGNILKYLTRHRNKNGAEDLKKCIHYCELGEELNPRNTCNASFAENDLLTYVTSNGMIERTYYDALLWALRQRWDYCKENLRKILEQEYGELS